MMARRGCSIELSRRELLWYGLGLSGSLLVGSGCAGPTAPHVVLITLDTTRADRLSCYGYTRPTSPNLDALAEESILYTRAVATSSWTLPSHASIFTGKFPTSHGARYDPQGPLRLTDGLRGPSWYGQYRVRGLGPTERTLASLLGEAGYLTGAVVAGPWMKRVFGLDRGFDFYEDDSINALSGRLAADVTSAALRWLEETAGRERFLFLNYFDPHGPYGPPQSFLDSFLPGLRRLPPRRQSMSVASTLYDAEILYVDHHVGRLLEGLETLGLYDQTMIIVTADHGELFGEHGASGHGNSLYQEEVHIPLFVKYPRGEFTPARSNVPIQQIDILPLVFERLGIALPSDIQGGSPPDVDHPVIAEVYPLPAFSSLGTWRALFDGDLKFVENSRGDHLLYDLKEDPNEERNLIAREPARAAAMRSRLSEYLASLPALADPGPDTTIDEDTREALENLGYIE
jgi:arylsulfatase A-like enzyme